MDRKGTTFPFDLSGADVRHVYIIKSLVSPPLFFSFKMTTNFFIKTLAFHQKWEHMFFFHYNIPTDFMQSKSLFKKRLFCLIVKTCDLKQAIGEPRRIAQRQQCRFHLRPIIYRSLSSWDALIRQKKTNRRFPCHAGIGGRSQTMISWPGVSKPRG